MAKKRKNEKSKQTNKKTSNPKIKKENSKILPFIQLHSLRPFTVSTTGQNNVGKAVRKMTEVLTPGRADCAPVTGVSV